MCGMFSKEANRNKQTNKRNKVRECIILRGRGTSEGSPLEASESQFHTFLRCHRAILFVIMVGQGLLDMVEMSH